MLRRGRLLGLLLAALGCTAERQVQKAPTVVEPFALDDPRRSPEIEQAIAIADANPRSPVGERALLEHFHRYRVQARRVLGERFVSEYPESPECKVVLWSLADGLRSEGDLEGAHDAASRLISLFPSSSEAISAALLAANLKRQMGDVAGAARELAAFATATAVPRHLLEELAELQRDAGSRSEAMLTAKRLLQLDPDNGTSAAIELEQAMSDDPNAPVGPMLERLAAAKRDSHNLERSVARATRLLLDFWFQQLKRTSSKDDEAMVAADLMLTHEGFALVGSDEARIGQIWRMATIRALFAEWASARASATSESQNALSALRSYADALFAVCSERAAMWDVVTPEATACRKKQTSLTSSK